MGRTSTPKPHPLTPSPRRGEGEHKEKSSRSSPLSALRRGGQGVRTAFTRKLLAWWARAARDLHALGKCVAGRGDAGKGVTGRRVAELPDDPAELIKLPGIGPYTAGAVASFAYEKPVPAVDTNVARVMGRVFLGDNRQRLSGNRQRLIWSLAAALVPKNGKRAWRFNQAIMELGALICVARKPRCPQCPVRPVCRTGKARRTDAQR